jgi:hypothetical protein
MKVIKMSSIILGCLGFTLAAHANEILLTATQSMPITFRIVHQNYNSPPMFGKLQTVDANKNPTIKFELDNYDLAGVTIVSVVGKQLPTTANQFNQPKQCALTTDKNRATGAMEFTAAVHIVQCKTYGGLFG